MNAPTTRPPLTNAELVAEADACRALWVAIVERVMLDADHDSHDGAAARDWLKRPDPMVLELAGLCPAAATEALGRLQWPLSTDAGQPVPKPPRKRRRAPRAPRDRRKAKGRRLAVSGPFSHLDRCWRFAGLNR